MLDLKNCPFCGGEMEDRGYGAVHIDGESCPIGYLAVEVGKWNRRALQAVGPEPAVAVKPLVAQIDALLALENPVPAIPHLARSLLASARSALVATPPAERVVEAANVTTVRLWDFANGDYRYPSYRGRAPEGTPTLRGDIKTALDMLATLAAKPAVKDNETVVDRLDVEIASLAQQPRTPSQDGWLSTLQACRAALTAKGLAS